MTLLTVDKLSVSFGDFKAVDNISFSIEKGEMLALVGESGSGKSISALSCLGLEPESARVSGSVRFDKEEMVGAPDIVLRQVRGKRIGMIFQEPMTSLNPLHTIGNQIGEAIALHRGAASTARIAELLEQVGLSYLTDRLDSYPHQLSGGERQRVMIAMAIANGPDLLIADEPTTAVDVTVQAKILLLLKKLQKEMGMAILFITHDLTIVKRLSDRVAVMKEGALVEQGKTAELFAAPKHPYTQKLIASEPKGTPPAPPRDAKPVMACEGLKVYFPIKAGLLKRTKGYVKAVDDITVTIPEASTLGIVGESGSGKSTLGFALLRLIKSEGKIVFLGDNIAAMRTHAIRPLRSRMQLVFQDPFTSLNPRMNVEQIIGEGLLVHYPDLTAQERRERIGHILEEVGLNAASMPRYPHEFSGGQRQRISIARAMVLKPKFVVLDEPTSALDLTVQAQIVELLRGFQKSHGLSYLFISHDLRVVKAMAHRIIVMHQGKIVEQGDADDIFVRPQEKYTQELIKAAFLK